MKYIYLHGFASSPRSTKAQDLKNHFQSVHRSLEIPDLNQDDFQNLTLTRQIQQVKALIQEPTTLIGSSFGGLTAAWIAQECKWVDRIILLAPAFHYLDHWLPTIKLQNPIEIYHYGEGRSMLLNDGIVTDLKQYDEAQLTRSIPTLILHGIQDEIIPIAQSRDYTKMRSWVRLIELDSDHALTEQTIEIWQAIRGFCAV